MSWHRSLKPGPVWVTDEELAEQVKERDAEMRRSEQYGEIGVGGPVVEAGDARELLAEWADGMREAAANGYGG